MATGTTTKLTYDDYLLIPNDGLRHEIIDGEHVVSPSAHTKHQVVVGNIFLALSLFVRPRRAGRVLHAPYDVVLSDADVLQPDVLFVSSGRMHVITKANLRGAPDLAVSKFFQSRTAATTRS